MSTGDERVVLATNAGSGTIRITAHRVDERGDVRSCDWGLDVVRHTDPQTIRVRHGDDTIEYEADRGRVREAVAPGLEMLWSGTAAVLDDPRDVSVVGHRIVHGGDAVGPEPITDEVRSNISRWGALAPLHNPVGLSLVDLLTDRIPQAVHVAVYDTSFHASIPLDARLFGGPADWQQRGLLRYGFHGISLGDATARAAAMLARDPTAVDLICVHLGGGCSVTAVQGGRSVATTMGATPTDGLVMATRSGSLDPGLLVHLLRRDGLDADGIEDLLARRSGVMGLMSGRTGDIAEVHRLAVQGDQQARTTEAVYVRSVACALGAMRPSLDALDAVVFTGSVGESEAWLRSAVLDRVGFLGVSLDPAANVTAVADADLSGPGSSVRTLVVASDENRVIARHAALAAGTR